MHRKIHPVKRTPPEIWRLILTSATAVEPPNYHDPLLAEARPNALRVKCLDSRKTCQNLIRVCRAWRELAPELVYTQVILFSIQNIANLARTLTQSIKTTHSRLLGYGWWIKHIHVCIQEQERSQIPYEYDRQLEYLLDLCPNLNSFTADSHTLAFDNEPPSEPPSLPTPCAVIIRLGDLFGSSLKRIEWDGPARVEFCLFMNLIMMCPNLEVVTVAFVDTDRPDSQSQIILPEVKCLHIRLTNKWLSSALKHWTLNSLQHLIISSILPNDIETLTPFFERHGAQLSSLELRSTSPGMQASLFLDMCPNLCDLVIPSAATIFVSTTTSHPSLRRIAFDSMLPELGTSYPYEIENLKTHFSNLRKGWFPKLECVRVVDRCVLDELVYQSWLKDLIDVWDEKAIRFEDSEGRPLIKFLL